MSAYCEDHDTWDDCIDRRWEQRQRDASPGDPATLCYPSDRYPLVVTARTGKTITLAYVDEAILEDRGGVPGEQRGGFPLINRGSVERNLPPTDRTIVAHWSEKNKRWQYATHTPVVVGYARYLRDWSL